MSVRVKYGIHTLRNQRQILLDKLIDLDRDYFKSYDQDKVNMLRDRIKKDITDLEKSIEILENY
jgi:hypothetical protein